MAGGNWIVLIFDLHTRRIYWFVRLRGWAVSTLFLAPHFVNKRSRWLGDEVEESVMVRLFVDIVCRVE